MTKKIPKGIYAASLAPLNSSLRCNTELLVSHCKEVIERGCEGVVLFGTTGEGPSFSLKEKLAILNSVFSGGLQPKQTIVCNSSHCLSDTIELGRQVKEQNALAYMISPPSYYKNISDDGVLAYYRRIIHSLGDLAPPIILYHIPQVTGVPLSIKAIQRLRREFPETVVGVKESEGNLQLTQALLEADPDLQVFVGNEAHIPKAIAMGASGSICGMANLWPEMIVELFQKGSSPRFEETVEFIKPYPFIPLCKTLLAKMRDPSWQYIQPPLTPLTEEESQEVYSHIERSPADLLS